MNSKSIKSILIMVFLVLSTSVVLSTAQAADVAMGDKNFLENAAQSNRTEIEGSEMAKSKTKNSAVLSFADQMIKDHTKATEQLKALAQKKGVEVPNEPSLMQKGKLKLLSTKDGADFDESYATIVGVAAHEATIQLFEDAVKDAEDPEIKQFAQKMLPQLKTHYQHAKELKSQVAKK